MGFQLRDISLRKKFLITLGGYVSVIAIILLAHGSTVTHVQREIQTSHNSKLATLLASSELLGSFDKINTLFNSIVVTGETSLQTDADKEKERFLAILQRLINLSDPVDQHLASGIRTRFLVYYPERAELAHSIGTVDNDNFSGEELARLGQDSSSRRLNIANDLIHLVTHHTQQHQAHLLKTAGFARQRLVLSIGVGMIAVIVLTAFFALISQSIVRPISALSRVAENVAQGNLDAALPADEPRLDEVGVLSTSFRNMLTNLQNSTVSRDYFDSVIQSTADMLIVLRPDYTIDMINRAVVKTLGRTEADLLHTHIRYIIKQPLFEADNESTPPLYDHVEIELIADEGALVPASFSCSAIRRRDQTIQWYVCMATDVTQQRLAAHQLQTAKEEAIASGEAKSEFLANVSHEIRTPINGVLGMLTQLLDTKLEETQVDFARAALASGSSLLDLINDILDFSKIEAGKLDIESIPYDLRYSIDELVDAIALRAHEKNLTLTILIDPTLPEILTGDPTRVRQVLLNLFSNSLKFTSEGTITIAIREITSATNETVIRYSVTDTGIGIPARKQAALFQPFTQADSSTTRRFGGTGLGLSICRELTTLMNGELGVDSTFGDGSTFWFSIPHPMTSPSDVPRRKTRASLKGITILTVVADSEIAEPLKQILDYLDATTSVTPSLTKAIETCSAKPAPETPYVLIIEQNLIETAPAELLDQLATERARGALRVAIVSPSNPGQASSISKHSDAHLSSPLRYGQLQAIINELTGHIRPDDETSGTNSADLPGQNHAILLVEDNIINQKVAVGLLSKMGYHLDIANNGQEAVAQMESGQYDIILMDCQMPIMDGYQATARIRKMKSPLCDTPIIAMTANAMQSDRQKCLDAGMDDYIAKPINAKHVNTLLQNWIYRKKT